MLTAAARQGMLFTMKIRAYKTTPQAHDLKYGTQSSSCFDLCACLHKIVNGYDEYNDPVTYYPHPSDEADPDSKHCVKIGPHSRVLIPTGYIFDIPEGHSIRVYPRSGLALKRGIALANGVGVVDSDYVEEMYVLLHNTSGEYLYISDGERIAQAELVLDIRAEVEYIQDKPTQKTDRVGGFGSTGVSK